MPRGMQPQEERFWSKVDRRSDDECWPWLGGLKDAGYGIFQFGGRNGTWARAHRYIYELMVGPIPDGFEIDHVRANGCTRRDCVNYVQHLEPVTKQENNRRSDSASACNARKTHCPQDHPYDEENTRITPEGNRVCRTCHREREWRRHAAKRSLKT